MAYSNWYFIFTVIVLSCGGIPKGYDEGGFSASIGLASFKNDFHLNASQWESNPSGLANRKANIASFGVLGAAFGSLLAVAINDRFGRLNSWRFFLGLWATGILMQAFSSGNYKFMLAARIWGGLGSGGLTVISPLFLSEIARAQHRGLVVSIYMVTLLSFLSLGFFVNYGVSKGLPPKRTQYRLVQTLPLIPCTLAFICSFFLEESPRWLASKNKGEEALSALTRLRGSKTARHDVESEALSIQEQMSENRRSLSDVTTIEIIKEVLFVRLYRKRLILALLMQTVAQWSGGNGITYYVADIFSYAGVTGSTAPLVTSGAYGIVKLVFTMIFAWGLVDYFGRRRSMITGILLQLAAHIYMSIYMAKLYQSQNKTASDAAIASIFVYAVGWSIGLCTVQYIYATEIFPTRIRGVCYAVNMVVHWFFQFAVVRVTPDLFLAFGVWGAFLFWACVCAVGAVLLAAMAPETKQVPIEEMDALFENVWYMGWRGKIHVEEMNSVGDTEKMSPEVIEVSEAKPFN